ncbi:MAG: hypothetical protein OSJ73_08190 [Lachnospiraceae bacterium]|nr:hypothetical protein [Lachnospiraceae bacterium]HBV83925.1 hypothetical protein [Lachnospiraceae bacterium]
MGNHTDVFSDFARRAKERIEQRKKKVTKRLRVESAGVDITIRGLTDQEISDCMEFSDDSLVADKYLIYMACPELQENAAALVEAKVIKQHYEICDMFSGADRRSIAEEIMKLSGVYEESSVKSIDEVAEAKN